MLYFIWLNTILLIYALSALWFSLCNRRISAGQLALLYLWTTFKHNINPISYSLAILSLFWVLGVFKKEKIKFCCTPANCISPPLLFNKVVRFHILHIRNFNFSSTTGLFPLDQIHTPLLLLKHNIWTLRLWSHPNPCPCWLFCFSQSKLVSGIQRSSCVIFYMVEYRISQRSAKSMVVSDRNT